MQGTHSFSIEIPKKFAGFVVILGLEPNLHGYKSMGSQVVVYKCSSLTLDHL